MRDEPSGAALIEAARRALTEEVVPGLTGRPRYVALMVANALGIAIREIGEAGAMSEAVERVMPPGSEPMEAMGAALVTAIRSGRHDGDANLHEALRRASDVAAAIWKARPGEQA